MEHCDDEVIALVALGETPSPDDAAHLRSCAACGGEVDRLARVTVALRVPVDEGVPSELRLPVEPPPAVWEAIARATADGTTEGVAPVLPLRPRPARRGWLLPAAAALVVGVALTLVFFTKGGLGMAQNAATTASIFLGLTFGLLHIAYAVAVFVRKPAAAIPEA